MKQNNVSYECYISKTPKNDVNNKTSFIKMGD